MSPERQSLTTEPAAEIRYLRSARAVRERAGLMLELARQGKLQHFALDEGRLPELAEQVVAVTRAAYPDLRKIPYHSRFRHFAAGGVDRARILDEHLSGAGASERLMAETELVVLSVLLDAGAGPSWSYTSAEGQRFARSEGLAVASFEWFLRGGCSRSGRAAADTDVLEMADASALAQALQVTPENPLVGLDGRAALLRGLGRAVRSQPEIFGHPPRLGQLGAYLRDQARGSELAASAVLEAVLAALGPIWPGREVLFGVNLGDVWSHPALGRVPFHKLSQWLGYSLCEALERSGLRVTGMGELTGLAEYRNGGLFLDGGALLARGDAELDRAHDVGSPVVVEWRALTVALLDAIAVEVRRLLGLSAEELPLARVLEGGTWATGRALAFARRKDGAPPLRVASDGTVF